MSELKFSDNYHDMSVQHGVTSGFQFEFYCERCNDTWRTDFVPYRSGQVSGWADKAAGMLGGIFGSVGGAVDGLAQAGWGSAHDDAFRNSVEQAKRHFHRCAKCFQYVCDTCWNTSNGLCLNCAPSAEVAVEAARAQGMVDAAAEFAAQEGARQGAKVDVERPRQLVCPQCKAETKGARFCPECGFKLAQQGCCSQCSAEMPPGSKFCPECGARSE